MNIIDYHIFFARDETKMEPLRAGRRGAQDTTSVSSES